MTAAEISGTPLAITLDLKARPWPDLADRGVREGMLTRIGALPGGMQGGRTSIALIVELDDGTFVFAQTSWRLLHTAAAALQAYHGVPD